MKIQNFNGVKELTMQESEKINGGGCWSPIVTGGLSSLFRTIGTEAVASFLRSAGAYICSLFS